MRGKYVCIEGTDGSGKSTLARSICQYLEDRGRSAVYRWFPSDNPVGALIRSSLRGDVLLDQKAYLYLFCADGLQANGEIEHHLELGRHVICDRHPTLSGRVFQVDHHEVEIVDQIYDFATDDGVLVPDYLFVLDVPADVSLARMEKREKYKDVVFESDDLERIAELRRRYMVLADRYNATILSGELDPEALIERVIELAGL